MRCYKFPLAFANFLVKRRSVATRRLERSLRDSYQAFSVIPGTPFRSTMMGIDSLAVLKHAVELRSSEGPFMRSLEVEAKLVPQHARLAFD